MITNKTPSSATTPIKTYVKIPTIAPPMIISRISAMISNSASKKMIPAWVLGGISLRKKYALKKSPVYPGDSLAIGKFAKRIRRSVTNDM